MDKETVLGIVRHILGAVGSVLVTKGYIDSAGLEAMIGGALAGGAVLWSILAKRKTATPA